MRVVQLILMSCFSAADNSARRQSDSKYIVVMKTVAREKKRMTGFIEELKSVDKEQAAVTHTVWHYKQ